MMKQILTSAVAVALFGVAACGQPGEKPTEDTAESAAQTPEAVELARAETSDEPEIGDRVPDPDEAGAEEKARTDALSAGGIMEIGWEELMPEGEEERIAEMYQAQMAQLYSRGGAVTEGSVRDQAIQIGTFNTVQEINGKAADGLKIRLPGYTVPFEYGSDAAISEFLLVPYYGACLHAPPPPPNQTVFVSTDDKIKLKDLSQAVWIEGTLRTRKQTSDLADTAYTIEMTDWEVYEY